MAKKKNNTKVEKKDTIENRRDLHKLYLFITVVGYSESDLIVKMLMPN